MTLESSGTLKHQFPTRIHTALHSHHKTVDGSKLILVFLVFSFSDVTY